MRKQQYIVKLSGKERSRLEDLIRKGKSPAKKQLKARILLQADSSKKGAAWNDPQISKALGTYPIMCARVRRQWTEEGLDGVLSRKQRATPPTPRIFDGEKEAKLIALACSPPPAGRTGWTLRLLENKVVELNIVDHASDKHHRAGFKKKQACAKVTRRILFQQRAFEQRLEREAGNRIPEVRPAASDSRLRFQSGLWKAVQARLK